MFVICFCFCVDLVLFVEPPVEMVLFSVPFSEILVFGEFMDDYETVCAVRELMLF